MGARTENRFRKYNREYTDRLLEEKKDRIKAASMFEEIQDLRAALKAEREKGDRAMACIKRLRVYLSDARRQTAEARAEAEHRHKLMMGWLRTSEKYKRAWLYVSRILRDLCTPEQVDRWREENKES